MKFKCFSSPLSEITQNLRPINKNHRFTVSAQSQAQSQEYRKSFEYYALAGENFIVYGISSIPYRGRRADCKKYGCVNYKFTLADGHSLTDIDHCMGHHFKKQPKIRRFWFKIK